MWKSFMKIIRFIHELEYINDKRDIYSQLFNEIANGPSFLKLFTFQQQLLRLNIETYIALATNHIIIHCINSNDYYYFLIEKTYYDDFIVDKYIGKAGYLVLSKKPHKDSVRMLL